ncbi:PTS fructose transporter subunit IIC [Loigolactobacillus coryniformis subsp. coryniformis]|uniref:PTS system fructose-specific transporter subunit IIC n=1 Tax=Loigolactobacillus coryniformis subsp. coryniformis KCTC 3167 = DSM 20001 TaxID=913848 RepID=A0A0R1EXG7_9LACO|nr:PTS fructose transporter subunit IIC [Loigolactobacillus coryniformis]ATO56325.1 PTS fructose transporter subunit IIC [Loigolactobacillus coryniformis subsp. coryniformis KCTC 3167 = DSM 20001]KRK14249.1 PTS system fructose-specific transporter subunit IIC [Loigolactobacillus coryniformis subsp. coryniformis KCTC 3167 = DSM 20001]OEH90993.1 PTS fructose transporter subunit IIC [Loigolactobacillus coryniformis subsp. coryniformis]
MLKQYKEIFTGQALKRHFLSGLSFMIPVIIMMGFCTAIGRIIGNTDVKGTVGYYLLQAGSAGSAMMIAVLAAGIGYSIAGKSAIAPGLLGGYLSTVVNASFIGGILCGLLAGIVVVFFNNLNVPKTIKTMIPLVIIPLVGGILETLIVMYVIGPPLAALTKVAVTFFLGMNHGSKFLLGFMLGSMTGFDMGGPVNKVAFAIVTAFATSGVWGPAAGKNVAAMAPPLGIALSVLLFSPKKYTKADRENAKAAIIMSMCQVTEGALPFAFEDPVRVVPAVVLGSGTAHGLILTWGVTVPLLSGGIFTIPVASNPLLYLAALLIGASITGIILSIIKPKIKEDQKQEKVHDLDINIDFG